MKWYLAHYSDTVTVKMRALNLSVPFAVVLWGVLAKKHKQGVRHIAKKFKNITRRNSDKLGKQCWIRFCSRIHPRNTLARTWKIAKNRRAPPQQQYPFRSLALHQQKSVAYVRENVCASLSCASKCQSIILSSMIETHPTFEEDLDDIFTLQDLETALHITKRLSSPRSDDITHSALCYFGPNARENLLRYLNELRTSGYVLTSWSTTRTVPFPKPGKPLIALSFYRLINLESWNLKFTAVWKTRTKRLASCNNRKRTRRGAALQVSFSAFRETDPEVFQTGESLVEFPSISCRGLQKREDGLC